ncbi:NADP-dependent oxidoreductase [bacterium]|nr:MAG: NADP-dependent oxidoreductase [bacterium]
MRAIVTEDGKPSIGERPEPRREGTVRIAVKAMGLNRGNLRQVASRLVDIAGWDVAGIDEQGQRVVALVPEGGFAEAVCAEPENIAPIPDGVSFETAAALPVAALTALRCIRDQAQLLPGQRLLITGAAGGVGTFAIQMAAEIGARVVGVVGDAQKAAYATQLGAHETVVAGRGSLLEALAERRFEAILESVGGTWLAQAMKLLAPGGVIALFGNSSSEPTTFEARDLFGNSRRIHGFFVFSTPAPRTIGHDLAAILDRVAAGKLRVPVDRVYPFDEAVSAFAQLKARDVRGKIVLTL